MHIIKSAHSFGPEDFNFEVTRTDAARSWIVAEHKPTGAKVGAHSGVTHDEIRATGWRLAKQLVDHVRQHMPLH